MLPGPLARADHFDLIPPLFEHTDDKQLIDHVVLGDQDAHAVATAERLALGGQWRRAIRRRRLAKCCR